MIYEKNAQPEQGEQALRNYFGPLPLASIFGVFFSLCLWEVFEKGTAATGIQTTAWLLLAVAIVLRPRRLMRGLHDRTRMPWIFGMLLYTLPFAFFENPFFETIHWFVFPFTLLLVGTILRFNYPEQAFEGVVRTLSTFYSISKRVCFRNLKRWPFSRLFRSKKSKIGSSASELRRYVLPGLLTFVLVGVVSVLLCTADSDFATSVLNAFQFFANLISISAFLKIVVAILLTFSILYCRLATSSRNLPPTRCHIDPGFVVRWAQLLLPSLILTYSWFLAAQMHRFSPDTLPSFFGETEHLVKAGFWQLIAVGFINLIVTTAFFARATGIVRSGCQLLTFLSLGLLATAGYRVGLYAVVYGLSYEKFYAAYTVLYCLVLFLWLVARTLQKTGQAPLWMATKLAFAMYAFVGIFPVERLIWEVNMTTKNTGGSRERLADMRMLSGDVLSLAKRDAEFLKTEKGPQLLARGKGNDFWGAWISEKESLQAKPWYQKTLPQIFSENFFGVFSKTV